MLTIYPTSEPFTPRHAREAPFRYCNSFHLSIVRFPLPSSLSCSPMCHPFVQIGSPTVHTHTHTPHLCLSSYVFLHTHQILVSEHMTLYNQLTTAMQSQSFLCFFLLCCLVLNQLLVGDRMIVCEGVLDHEGKVSMNKPRRSEGGWWCSLRF